MKTKRKTKKRLSLILIAIIIIGIVGVVGYLFTHKEKVEDLKNVIPDIIKESEPPKKVQVVDLDSNTRPVAVMINNNSAVWSYQSGLNDAYIVYEMLVEGGITREMAVFKDNNTPKIQSIRSSRHYFLDYALENDAVYVHWGWSPQAQSDISSLKINNLNGLTYENVYFFRDNTVKAAYEHKGYISSENINKAIKNLKYRATTEEKPLLNYSVDSLNLSEDEKVQDATYVEIKYSGSHISKFTYDEESKTYLRTQNKTDMFDFNTKERFTAKNIITYQISYPSLGDDKGRLNASNIGNGSGYYISEGKAVPITWEKKSRSAKTIYKRMDGSELVVNDGNTYIMIQPKNQTLTIKGNEE